MNASPTWLEGLARGAAERQLRRAQTARAEADSGWGRHRFSRRSAVGGAAGAVVATSALRYVPLAQAAPACQGPCLKDAAKKLRNSQNQSDRAFRNRLNDLQNRLDDAKADRKSAKTDKARAAASARITSINGDIRKGLDRWLDQRMFEQDRFDDDVKRCKSDSQCGNPTKYPNGNPPSPAQPPDANGQSCPPGQPLCGQLCCPGGTKCCSMCQTCCILDVMCQDCCAF